MSMADASVDDLIFAPLTAACFASNLCSMPPTDTISHYIIFASINRAQPLPLLFHRAITFLHGYLALCNHTDFTDLSTAFVRGMSCLYCRINQFRRQFDGYQSSAEKSIKATREGRAATIQEVNQRGEDGEWCVVRVEARCGNNKNEFCTNFSR